MSRAAPSQRPVGISSGALLTRAQVPALRQEIGGHPLVYLDNAASTLRPQSVLDAMTAFEENSYSNVHRGVHTLSQRATVAFENARETCQRFLGAANSREVVFVRGTTEALNLVAQTHGHTLVGAGDEVLVSELEHHSNLVPWQMLCAQRGALVRKIPLCQSGDLDLEAYRRALNSRTKIVALGHVSNVLGTINPVAEMARAAHHVGATVVVDGAQAAPHLPVDVEELGCDFYALSAHKLYGPSGVGVLWGRAELLEAMPPWQGGGAMIRSVSFERTEWNDLPYKFEAGTPNITGAIGFAAALDLLDSLGRDRVQAHETALLDQARSALEAEDGVRVFGHPRRAASVLSFALEGIHAHDVGQVLDQEGVAVRVGHHCAQPVMDFYGVASTSRASFGIYNESSDIDRLIDAVRVAKNFFGR